MAEREVKFTQDYDVKIKKLLFPFKKNKKGRRKERKLMMWNRNKREKEKEREEKIPSFNEEFSRADKNAIKYRKMILTHEENFQSVGK